MNQLMNLPVLEEVIDPSPMTVSPRTPLIDVISHMSLALGQRCALSPTGPSINTDLQGQIFSDCVLVMARSQLVGIFTERDVVKLSAAKRILSQMRISEVMTQSVITMTLSNDATTLTALELLQQHQIRHLPVLTVKKKLVGIITPHKIRQALQPTNLLKLRRVEDVMISRVVSASRTTSLLKIAQLMAAHRVSCVVIADIHETPAQSPEAALILTPVGIITERDIVQFQVMGLNFEQTQAETIMSSPLFCLHPSDTLWIAHQQMQTRHVRRLVVAGDHGDLKGIITQTSLLRGLDPLELARIVETLHQEIENKTSALEQTNQCLQQEINERKHIENQLRIAQGELEHQVQQRTLELTKSNAQLQEELRERERFNAECKRFEVEREQTRRVLQQNEEQLRLALDLNSIGLWVWHIPSEVITWNTNHFRLLGFQPGEVVPTYQLWRNRVHPDDIALVEQKITQALETQTDYEAEYRVILGDSSIRWLLGKGRGVYDAVGQPVRMLGVLFDISDRKQDEARNREQAALIDIAPDAILVRDLDCRVLFWNKGAEQLYGWTTAEIVGQDCCEFLVKQPSSQLDTALQIVLDQDNWQGELTKITKSGSEVVVRSRWKLLRNEADQPHAILSVDTDITEQKQLEEQFLRTQRLESLGTLAGGIAHDLNNILTPMLVSTHLLPLNLPPLSERSQQILALLDESAKRGAALVKQILTFARGLESERAPIQVKHLLREIEQVIYSTFPKTIKIALNISTQDLWLVSADATQLHQVFMNLCVNARDAMLKGGTLSILAENQSIDETYAQMNLGAKVGSYVVITFADTGSGISPKHLDRIFDPFFTTKTVGEGTGLGLSTALGIIKNHGGFITVSSEVEQGTQFQIFLPAVESSERLSEENSELPIGQGELILVVDDEENIRETLSITLESQNYKVLTAKNGIEAITTYVQHQTDIQAVLLDMMMPLMGGATVVQVLQRFNSQVKVIACSGMPTDDSLLQPDIKAFLSKPFTSDELFYTLHKVLIEV